MDNDALVADVQSEKPLLRTSHAEHQTVAVTRHKRRRLSLSRLDIRLCAPPS